MTTTKINRWTILSTFMKGKHLYAHCLCECGKEKDVCMTNINSGKSKSCGCFRSEVTGFRPTHGGRRTKLYGVWCGIKQRCFDANCKLFKLYGERGITVCDEWANDFAAFRDWSISNGYEQGLVIDRKNTYGNYEPSNCRFVTQKVNMNNQRTNRIIEAFGETKTMAEWSEDPRCNIGYGAIGNRLNKGWSPEDAISLIRNARYIHKHL